MFLKPEEVLWVAKLARLELREDELAPMTEQLISIIDFVDQLKEVNTEGVEPMAHPIDYTNVFRDDEPGESLPVDEALANAPDRQGDFFGVPQVLE